MNAKNWGYWSDGKTFQYGRMVYFPRPKLTRPNDGLVAVVPTAWPTDPGPRENWIFLEMPEVAFATTLISAIQRKDFDEEDRYRLDLLDTITEEVNRVEEADRKRRWLSLGGIAATLDLWAATWDVVLRRQRAGDEHWRP